MKRSNYYLLQKFPFFCLRALVLKTNKITIPLHLVIRFASVFACLITSVLSTVPEVMEPAAQALVYMVSNLLTVIFSNAFKCIRWVLKWHFLRYRGHLYPQIANPTTVIQQVRNDLTRYCLNYIWVCEVDLSSYK